jgi:hypothetical protein
MAPLYKISNGWFTEVDGVRVFRRDCDEPGMDAFDYAKGYPVGIAQHYTAGCGTDLTGTMYARGYVLCTFSIDGAGNIYQYTPLLRGAWHAQDLSRYYTGVEYSALPGTCNLTDAQYSRGVGLNAAIVQAVADLKGFLIPLRHVGGCDITTPGLKEHADGAMPQRCSWNDKVHCDNPITIWGGGRPAAEVNKGWDKFLADIDGRLNPAPAPPEEGFLMALSDDEQARLYAVTYWTMRGTNNEASPGTVSYGGVDVTQQAMNGWKAGQVIRKAAGLQTRT